MQSSELIARGVALYFPIAVVLAIGLLDRPSRRVVGAAVVGFVWNLVSVVAVCQLAFQFDWWSFGVDGAEIGGVPADFLVGWALLWGAVPALNRRLRLSATILLLILVDLVLMPAGDPLVVLSDRWLIGELVAVLVCLIPGALVGHWMATDQRLVPRVLLQLVAFTGLLYWLLPIAVFEITGEDWRVLLDRPRWHFVVAFVLASPALLIALRAVIEFVSAGGTPVPSDPPKQLVTSGPYMYVGNPMQLGASTLLLIWSALLGSAAMAGAALVAVVFSAGVATLSEHEDLSKLFDDQWKSYRNSIRFWRIAWRPRVTSPARLYVAGGCEPCSDVGRFFVNRDSIDLEVVDAQRHAATLTRIRFESQETSDSGIVAIGRGLERINFGWALVGWLLMMPIARIVFQLIADVVGGHARLPVAGAPSNGN